MNPPIIGRLAAASLVGLLLAGYATADQPLDGAEIEALTGLLQLDAYQAGEVQRILEAQRNTIRAAVDEHRKSERAGKTDDHSFLKETFQEARSKARQELALILTAEQLAKYDGFVEGRERHR